MKEQASSIEYVHLVREFQEFVEGRIDKIYQEENFFFICIYTGKRRTNLAIELPNVAYITDNKPSFGKPGGFCMFLRKRLQKGRIRSIEQLGFDRIIKIAIDNKENYHVYIELFGKGNLIVCDEQDKIISLYDSIVYTDRALRGGQTYTPPPQQPNLIEMDEEAFSKYFGEEEPIKILASTIGLGGEYAEFILEKAGVDKNDVQADTKKIYSAVRSVLDEKDPEYSEKAAYPIHVINGKKIDTFSEAIAKIKDGTREQQKKVVQQKKATQHRNKYEKVLSKQRSQLKGFHLSSVENKRKGEIIYEHYQEIQSLLEAVKIDRKELDEKALKKKYSTHPLVKNITQQEIVIEVEE